jgi:putative intracellular protease/amidase
MIRRLKKLLLSLFVLVAVLGLSAWAYVHSLHLEREPKANPQANASVLGFVGTPTGSGRILAVVSSAPVLLDGTPTGFELTELSRAWWVFVGNGFQVDIASPAGGVAPMRKDDLIDADYAFLNHPVAQARLKATLRLADVDASQYRAIYFVGGKGAMLDFYRNADIERLVRDIAPRGVVGAVCHGPAALLDVRLATGELLLKNRTVTGFSNAEEHLLMKNPISKLGFMLQDQLSHQAAQYSEGPMYLKHVVTSGNVITGQNPWSTWQVAEQMVAALGHEPIFRRITTEEASVEILLSYRARGRQAALQTQTQQMQARQVVRDKKLILMHAVVAAMDGKLGDALALARLAGN